MLRSLPLLALAAVLVACSSSAPTIESTPASSRLVVDGSAADWAGTLQPLEDAPGLSFGVQDDGDAVTLALVANTPQQALLLSRGVTFWFDGEGGKDRAFGVGFPLRPERGARGQGRRGPGEGDVPAFGEGGPEPGARMGRVRERFEDGTDRMAVYRNGGGELQLAVGEVEGIEAEAAWTESALVIELRVPLQGSGGYAISAGPGGAVGLGIEMLDIPEEALAQRQNRRTGPPRVGRGGGRAGAPGGRAGRGGDGPRELPTETTWLRVQLSE